MSDETTSTDGGWSSATTNPAGSETAGAERVAFCQDCGKPLTQQTVRTVGTGVFCEPCLATRAGVAGAPAAGYVPVAGAVPVAGQIPVTDTGDPSPVLAGILGFIPGVGAMYNGQVAKGFVHLAIFAALVWAADHISGLFGLFIAGWIGYQVFDAIQTARARVEGLPLPNPFGFNDIGDRMGQGTTWKAGIHFNNRPAPPKAATPYPPVATDWVGYVPPTQFGGAAYPPPPPGTPDYAPTAYAQTAYAPPAYAPVAYAPTYAAAPAVPLVEATVRRRFPMGAIWLIGLGAVILAVNFVPDLEFGWRWLVPAVLAITAVSMLVQRIQLGGNIIHALRAPVILMTLAVLFALDFSDVLSFGRGWPILLVAIGAMLLVERTYIPGIATAAVPYSGSVVPPVEPAPEPARAAWSSTKTLATHDTSDVAKGGQ